VLGLAPSLLLPASLARRLAASLVAAVSLPSAAQFKCISPTGAVSFQQTPCAGAASSQKLDLPPAAPADPAAANAAAASTQRHLASLEWQSAVNQAIVGNYPLVGMTVAELDRALGVPNVVNTSDYGRGLEEQRIYPRGPRTWYVYTRGGYVTAIENTAGRNSAVTARQNCPSRQDMDNEAARLTSIRLSEAERQQGRERLAQLRRECQ